MPALLAGGESSPGRRPGAGHPASSQHSSVRFRNTRCRRVRPVAREADGECGRSRIGRHERGFVLRVRGALCGRDEARAEHRGRRAERAHAGDVAGQREAARRDHRCRARGLEHRAEEVIERSRRLDVTAGLDALRDQYVGTVGHCLSGAGGRPDLHCHTRPRPWQRAMRSRPGCPHENVNTGTPRASSASSCASTGNQSTRLAAKRRWESSRTRPTTPASSAAGSTCRRACRARRLPRRRRRAEHSRRNRSAPAPAGRRCRARPAGRGLQCESQRRCSSGAAAPRRARRPGAERRVPPWPSSA